MKYKHCVYVSESEALKELLGVSELKIERIYRPYHHENRVRVYADSGIVKKKRHSGHQSIVKTYREANSHIDLNRIGVTVPKLFGILHSEEECSLFLEYIDSLPLTWYIVKNDPNLHHHLKLVGTELGKMFEHGFLHGDLTSYHILVNGKVHIFDLETTRKYNGDEFFNRLAIEWEGFINSTQGRRWKIPFNKEQEEIVFESVRENITTRPTIKVLEKVVMKNNNSF